jgi:hypothetical protein
MFIYVLFYFYFHCIDHLKNDNGHVKREITVKEIVHGIERILLAYLYKNNMEY